MSSHDTVPVYVGTADPVAKKAEIKKEAAKRGKSVSRFMMDCYEIVVDARRKQEARGK